MMDDDELDDDVFINQAALQMNTQQSDADPALQMNPYFTLQFDPGPPSPITESPVPESKAFLKLVKTTQFVKKWTKRTECPIEPQTSIINDVNLYSASIQSVPTTFSRRNTLTGHRRNTLTRHRRLLDKKKLLQRVVWNPTGNWRHM